MGSLYRSQHELVLVFKQRGGPHRNNVQLGQFGRNRSNVWHYPGANSFARHGEEGNLLALHPTVKPVALVADAILDGSARGDIVLDAFLGSGTTVIAAERTGRRCNALWRGFRWWGLSRWRLWRVSRRWVPRWLWRVSRRGAGGVGNSRSGAVRRRLLRYRGTCRRSSRSRCLDRDLPFAGNQEEAT